MSNTRMALVFYFLMLGVSHLAVDSMRSNPFGVSGNPVFPLIYYLRGILLGCGFLVIALWVLLRLFDFRDHLRAERELLEAKANAQREWEVQQRIRDASDPLELEITELKRQIRSLERKNMDLKHKIQTLEEEQTIDVDEATLAALSDFL